jgi:hypothetical protein
VGINARSDSKAIRNAPQPTRSPTTLQRIVQRHVAGEAASMNVYESVVGQTDDPMARVLPGEVLDDKRHLHGVLRQLAARFAHELRWTSTIEDTRPENQPAPSAPSPDLLAAVRELADHERREAAALHVAAPRGNKKAHGGLFAVLLESMAIDSKKHEQVIRFVLGRMENAVRAETAVA